MSFKDECTALGESITKLREDAKKQAKDFFYEKVKQIFVLHPVVQRIVWTQYTPGFCDGDPCYFRSYHDDASVNGGGDYGDDFEFEGEKPDDYEKLLTVAESDVSAFLGVFSSEDMEDLFGDPIRVTITKAGIETDDYDCGY